MKEEKKSWCFTVFRSFDSIPSLGSWNHFLECEHEQKAEQGNEEVSRQCAISLTRFAPYKYSYTTADASHKISVMNAKSNGGTWWRRYLLTQDSK